MSSNFRTPCWSPASSTPTRTSSSPTSRAGTRSPSSPAGSGRSARSRTPPPPTSSLARRSGACDCWAAGVTCVADTGSTGAVMHALHALGGRGICYQEVFGPDPAQARTSLAELEQALTRLGSLASSRLRLGVSPPAPYTVSPPLYPAVDDLARNLGLPVAVHLAESREETQLVREGSGSFADALRSRGIPVQAQNCSPVQDLLRLGALWRATGWRCIHCVQVDGPDIETLRDAGVAGDAQPPPCTLQGAKSQEILYPQIGRAHA